MKEKETQKQIVLNDLRTMALKSNEFSTLGIPAPSVRRIVQELRADGFNILNTPDGYSLQVVA